jgi:hypothetical protein
MAVVLLLCSFRFSVVAMGDTTGNTTFDATDVFYINLLSSIERNVAMTAWLMRINSSVSIHRVEALSLTASPQFNISKVQYPCEATAGFNESLRVSSDDVVLTGLCIPPKNTLKEVACSLSHLKAISAAIKSPSTKPYALILEDDVQLAFDIDFDLFVREFPVDFAMVQMLVISVNTVDRLLNRYTKKGKLHAPWLHRYFSAGAYLINKKVMAQHIAGMLQSDIAAMRIEFIAGRGDCAPAKCCAEGRFQRGYPCVEAFDANADHYVFSLAPSRVYTSTIPLFRGSGLAANSTIGETHSHYIGGEALSKVDAIIDRFRRGELSLPPYARSVY